MRSFATAIVVLGWSFLPTAVHAASEAVTRASQRENAGDAADARAILSNAVQQNPNDAETVAAYASFLDRYQDAGAQSIYRKCLPLLPKGSEQERSTLRRLIELDLLAADRAAAQADLKLYRDAGGNELSLPSARTTETKDQPSIEIPGPLRSFARMSAIAGDSAPENVLPALARNVVTNGYQASRSNDVLEPTEYLKLLVRYVSQARELDKLAGPDKVIRIEKCESSQTGDLLRIIGFRMRGGCGSDVVLETVNAARAFITTDSGFPTAELEQALRTDRPFAYEFKGARVPVLFGAAYWESKEKGSGDFLDQFLADPALCRFYLGMAKLDRSTADELRAHVPMPHLRSYAHVLDFFGGMFEIKDGKAVTPGGERSASTWAELVGAPVNNGPSFFEKLLAKDDGWLASYYDSLARIHGPVQAYLTEPVHLKRFYGAIRGLVTSPGPARPVFRANADMMLLTTRLRLDPNGRPHVPGGVGVWRSLFVEHPHGKYDSKLARSANGWSDPDDVLEALFGLTRKSVENEALKIFMTIGDMDRYRAAPLAPSTVERLAQDYRIYGAQYSVLADAPALSDATIVQFLDTMQALDRVHDVGARQDGSGSMQALVGMWQIFYRSDAIPHREADKTLIGILGPFTAIRTERDVFDAARTGVTVLLAATGPLSGKPRQERILDLLAGGLEENDAEPHEQLVKEMRHVLDAQRIISLDTLLQLADGLESAASGHGDIPSLMKLAAKVNEVELPRPPLSAVEKTAITFGYWTDRHIEAERKLNLRAAIDRAGNNAEHLRDIRGGLAPLLRDTLVAYNYAHYAPPGAQVLYTNPLFVRGHDFIGLQTVGHTWRPAELLGTGWPNNGGGRLVGSLANLPYALAEAEQNFLIPTQTQALIWGDLVPQMILCAKIPRWWRVTPVQMHWVDLHMSLSKTLVAEAAFSSDLRKSVIDSLQTQISPGRSFDVNRLAEEGEVQAAIQLLTPEEMYVMASSLESSSFVKSDPAAVEIASIRLSRSAEVTDEAISRAFGTPKPTLASSYRSELLRLRTFPTLMGYSSRIMAESWESNTLYWASLADQMHLPPAQLNVVIPDWTQKVVERIFASHLEDWPALLRSLRSVGDSVRAGTASQSAGGVPQAAGS